MKSNFLKIALLLLGTFMGTEWLLGQCYTVSQHDTIQSCSPLTWEVNGQKLISSDLYSDTLVGNNGCDSIVYLEFQRNNYNQSIKTLPSFNDDEIFYGNEVKTDGQFVIVNTSKAYQVGAGTTPDSNSVTVYSTDSNGQWFFYQELYPVGNGNAVGFDKDIAIDNGNIFIGGPGEVAVFQLDSSGFWIQTQNLHPSDGAGGFGNSLAIHGNLAVIGTSSQNAYFFRLNTNGNWVEEQVVSAPNGHLNPFFGASVDIYDGVAVIGAPGYYDVHPNLAACGAVFAYEYMPNVSQQYPWSGGILIFNNVFDEQIGWRVSISRNFIVTSKSGSQSATSVYKRNPLTTLDTNLTFSSVFDINENHLVMRDISSGNTDPSVCLMEFHEGEWNRLFSFTPNDTLQTTIGYGASLSMNGRVITVGAPNDNTNGVNSGAAFIYGIPAQGSPYLDTLSVNSCTSYNWPKTTWDYSASGTYSFQRSTANCEDSLFFLELTISYPASTSDSITACAPFTSETGKILHSSGFVQDSLVDLNGCDSIHTTWFTEIDDSFCQLQIDTNMYPWHIAPQQVFDTTYYVAGRTYSAFLNNDTLHDLYGRGVDPDPVISVFANQGNGQYIHHAIKTFPAGTTLWDVRAADMDNDNDQDLVVSSPSLNRVYWFENLGNFNFQEHMLANSLTYPQHIHLSDVDQDGFKDILVASSNKLVLLRSDSANGTFTSIDITTGLTAAIFIEASDLDSDGDLDILGSDPTQSSLYWWEDTTGQQDYAARLISSSVSGYGINQLKADDWDEDGDLDIFFLASNTLSGNGNRFGYFRNDSSSSWTEVILDTVSEPTHFELIDFDGDLDTDILINSSVDDQLHVFERLGMNLFREHLLDSIQWSYDFQVVDVDSDNKWEIVSAGNGHTMIYDVLPLQLAVDSIQPAFNSLVTAQVNPEIYIEFNQKVDASQNWNEVLWFTTELQWNVPTSYTVDSNVVRMTPQLKEIRGEELNLQINHSLASGHQNAADRYMDAPVFHSYFIASGSRTRDWIIQKLIIDSLQYSQIHHLNIRDINFDGRPDIFPVSNQSKWIQNSTSGFVDHQYSSLFSDASAITHADLDEDGDVDIVIAVNSGTELYWLENVNYSWTSQPLGSYVGITDLAIADFNHDGHTDIIVADAGDSAVYWLENDGFAGFSSHNFNTYDEFYVDLKVHDIDLDGFVDVLTSSSTGMLRFLESEGGGEIVTNHFNGQQRSVLWDVDGDGDLNIISASDVLHHYDNRTIHPTNVVGNVSADLLYTFSNPIGDMVLADLDGDGRKDITLSVPSDSLILWINVDASLNVEIDTLIHGGTDYYGLGIADINLDGFSDIVYGAYQGTELGWLNLLTRPYLETHYPLNGQNHIERMAPISIVFDQPMDTTDYTNKIHVYGTISGTILGNFSGGGTDSITFTPSSPYHYGEEIRVIVPNYLENIYGLASDSAHQFAFRVKSEVNHWNGQVTAMQYHTYDINYSSPVDYDRDGDVDIIEHLQNQTWISYYENQSQVDSIGLAYTSYINIDNGLAVDGQFIDMDRDLDIDLITGVNLYKVDGTNFQNKYPIESSNTQEVDVFDADGDGDFDIMKKSYNYATLFINENDTSFYPTPIPFPELQSGGTDMVSADMDNDGDFDLVITQKSWPSNKIGIYENRGDAGVVFHEVYSQHSANHNNGYINAVTGDLDNDGDMDIVYASQSGTTIHWFEHLDTGSFQFQLRGISKWTSGNKGAANAVHLADLNGDGWLDVIGALDPNQELMIAINEKDKSFDVHYIAHPGGATFRLSTADMNGDGQLEIIRSHSGWYNSQEGGTIYTLESLNCDSLYAGFQAIANGTDVQFMSTASQGVAEVVYSFGTGDTASAFDTTYTYPSLGTYQVCQWVTDSCGNMDSLCQMINLVDPNLVDTSIVSSCESYYWTRSDSTYYQSGLFSYLDTSANGGDTLFTIDLSIHQTDSSYLVLSGCQSVTYNSMTFTANGIYIDSASSIHGCDSIFYLQVIVVPPVQGPTDSISFCGSYLWPISGELLDSSGTYTHTLTAANGCDSVMVLDLTISDPYQASASTPGSYTVQFNWNNVGSAPYWIYFREVGASQWTQLVSFSTSKTVRNRVPGDYAFYVAETGGINPSCTDTFTIVCDDFGYSANIFQIVDATAAKVNVFGIDGGRRRWDIALIKDGNDTTWASNRWSRFFTGLEAGDYHIRIRDAYGCYSSQIDSFTIDPVDTSLIPVLASIGRSGNDLTPIWSIPNSTGVDRYQVRVKDMTGGGLGTLYGSYIVGGGTTTQYTVTGLPPARYRIDVRARPIGGSFADGVYSNFKERIILSNKEDIILSSEDSNEWIVQTYPNPTTGKINVFSSQEGSLELYDMLGNLIQQQAHSGGELQLDLSPLSQGVYMLRISNGSQQKSERIVLENR